MKSSKTAPEWAVNLVTQVCTDYKRKLPTHFVWFRIKQYEHWQQEHSSGYTRYDGSKIFMRVGTSEVDQKLVLLHELAHHIVSKTRKGRREGHSSRFWKLAFELFDRYGVDLDYAWNREKNYKKKAAVGYQAILAKK